MKLRTLLLTAVLAAGLLAATLQAQISRSRIYSRPAVPSAEVLRRLNLVVAWRGYVPMDGSRDRIIRTELEGKDLFVLTASGLIARFDAETGRLFWRTRVAKPYTLSPFITSNSRSVYVGANADAFGLDRATGNIKWQYSVRHAIAAPPVADTKQIYVPFATGRLAAFSLPFVQAGEQRGDTPGVRSAIYGGREVAAEDRPEPVWEENTNIQLAFKPLKSRRSLFVISPSGQALGFSKKIREGAASMELYEFRTEGKIRVPQGQFGDIGYIGSDDATLYAVNINTGRLLWRHSTGSAVTRKPVALAGDVYVTAQVAGLSRVDRATGDSVWKVPLGRQIVEFNTDADRFLAANDRFVYASDHSNRLLVLDRKRGRTLTMLDTRAFHVPIVNEVTDRLYLAANDGLIVCLRDRDLPDPIRHRRAETILSPLVKLLEQPVTSPAFKDVGKPAPLRDVLDRLQREYKIEFDRNERAFRGAGMSGFLEREVRTPAAKKQPLKEFIQDILTQANATFQIDDEEDTVLLIPHKRGE
jgi:hypothetical protein